MVYMAEGKVGETLTFKHGLHEGKVGETLTFKHGLYG